MANNKYNFWNVGSSYYCDCYSNVFLNIVISNLVIQFEDYEGSIVKYMLQQYTSCIRSIPCTIRELAHKA